jgi:hypothetical protein
LHFFLRNPHFFIFLTLIFHLFASVTFAADSEKEEQEGRKCPIFTTGKEMVIYGSKLFQLCTEKRFKEASEEAFPEPIIRIDTPTLSDWENYSFLRLISLTMIDLHNANLNILNPEISIDYYHKSAEYVNQYLCSFEAISSQIGTVNKRMIDHRALMYKEGSQAYSEWARLLIKPNMESSLKEEPKNLLTLSINYQKQFLFYAEKSEILKINKDEFLAKKHDLFNEYITIIPLCSGEEKKEFLKEAKEIARNFKTNQRAKKYYEKMSLSLKFIEKREEKEVKDQQEQRGNLKKIAAFKEKKQKEEAYAFAEMIRDINDLAPRESLFIGDVLHEHQRLCSLALINLQNPEIVVSLQKIEESIQNELRAGEKPSKLSDVYEKYATAIGAQTFVNEVILYALPAILVSGDVEGALERITILSNLEYQHQKNNSSLTRFMRAAINNMNGNYAEWQELEKEVTDMQEKKKAKKKKVQQKKRANLVAAAKASQEEAIASDAKKAAKKEHSLPQGEAMNVEKKEISHLENFIDIPSLSVEEAKQQKAERHAEAEEKGQEAQKVSSSHSSPLASSSSSSVAGEKAEVDPQVIQASDHRIQDLYLLTGVAKIVDKQIEDGAWQFSRENLIAYFEALGCTAKDGGKHKKVSLPKAIIVRRGDELISIINDLGGGALTLPRWDGSEGNGYVPAYLRKQILEARKKLLKIALKEAI